MKKSDINTIHETPAVSVAKTLETSLNNGLNKDAVFERRGTYGENLIREKDTSTFFSSLIRELTNPLSLILLVAVGLTVVLEEYIDAVVIALAIVLNVSVAMYQERKAGDAFKALQKKRVHKTVVTRDGQEQEINAEELVPGDVVVLQTGAYVPADGRIVDSNRLTINQVMFTGESEAVEKNSGVSHEKRPFDRTNMAFMGTVVITGSGVMVVTKTGENTRFGSIAEQLATIEKDDSPIQKTVKQIARILGYITLCAFALILAVGLYRGMEIYSVILLAIAVGVSAVPEGLLSAVTVVLAFGAREIMRQGGLVKNLSSAETLGSANYILTDKTGTLTYGEMKVEEWFVVGSDISTLKQYAGRAIDVFYDHHTHRFVSDEMDTALAHEVYKSDVAFEEDQTNSYSVNTIPFDSSYKFFAQLNKEQDGHVIYLKGAPERVMDHVTHIREGDSLREITQKDKQYFENILQDQTSSGKRLLAVASRSGVGEQVFDTAWDSNNQALFPEELVFEGLVSFYDRVRPSVRGVIDDMRQSGTSVIMITGDNLETAHTVALEAGIITDEKEASYSGEDIDNASDEHLYEIMSSGQARVFGRVTPEHKMRLAEILQSHGETVAMTGDGVNDAPALQKATIGISLSSATEVAKEAADLVLVDNSFDTIAYAIQEGRRMINNLKKTIVYLLSTSFSIVFVLLGSLVVAGPVPFYATQILWANLLEEGLMNFAFIFEPDDKKKKRVADQYKILNAHTKSLITTIGIVNGIKMFALYVLLISMDMSATQLSSVMFASLSLDSIMFGLAIKSLYEPSWKLDYRTNWLLVVFSGFAFMMLILAFAVPALRTALHIEPLGTLGYVFVIISAIMNLLLIEIVKKMCK